MLRTAFVPAIVLFLAGGSHARDACLHPTDGFGCFPCDLPIEMAWIGYSTSGLPCESPTPAPAVQAADDAAPDVDRGWWTGLLTLSASATDPFVNQGPLATVPKTLHLWLADAGCGYGFNNTSITFEGDLPLTSYEPVAQGTHTWIPTGPGHGVLHLGLYCVGSLTSPTLVGKFLVSPPLSEPSGPELLGVERSSWGSVKSRWLRSRRAPAR